MGKQGKTATMDNLGKVGGLRVECPEKRGRMSQYLCPPCTSVVFGVLLIIQVILVGCGSVAVISPVNDPVFVRKGEVFTPEVDGWFVTQGFMEEVIEHTE